MIWTVAFVIVAAATVGPSTAKEIAERPSNNNVDDLSINNNELMSEGEAGWGSPAEKRLRHKVSIANNGGIAKASSKHSSGNHEPMNAFGDSGFWHSNSPYTVPQTIWVEFTDNLLIIVKYSFTSRTDNENYVNTDGPSKYIFWASNYHDCSVESQWVILMEDNSGTPFAKTNVPKEMSIRNLNPYRCYGFKVNDVPGRHGIKPVTIANIKLYSVKGGECRIKLPCAIAGGYCVTNANDCRYGRLIVNGCGGKLCQCCIPGCPENQGFFRLPHPSNQCFKLFDRPGNWYAANTTCHEAGLVLARPLEMISLKNYLVLRYGDLSKSKIKSGWPVSAWLDGMTNGTCMKWNRGPYECISKNIPRWWDGQPNVAKGHCLLLNSNAYDWKRNNLGALYCLPCSKNDRYPLCELLM